MSYWFLYLGITNIISTLFIFLSLTKLFLWFIDRFVRSSYKRSIKTSINIVFFTLMFVEVGLRTIKSDHEKFNYYNPYTRVRHQNLIKKVFWEYEDVRIFNHKANFTRTYEKPEFTYIHQYNCFGARNVELNSNQLNDSYKILCLGDSFTEGVGAPGDSTWVSILGNRLDTGSNNVTTINGARSGSDIFYEFFKLKNLYIDAYDPNLVIFALNSTDVYDVSIRGGNERFISNEEVRYKDPPLWSPIYSISYTFRLLISQGLNINYHRLTSDEAKEDEDAIRIIQKLVLSEIIPFSKEKNFDVLFLFTPTLNELKEKQFILNPLEHAIKAVDTCYTMNLFDIYPSYEPDSHLFYYWKEDRHCNSKGYSLWGESIANKLTVSDRSCSLLPISNDVIQ